MEKISKEKNIFSMSAQNAPVLHVMPGDQVCFEVPDAFGGQITSADDEFNGLDWGRINPAVGPVYVNTAMPGDILSVKIESIEVAQSGVVVCGKDMGVMGDVLTENTIKIVQIVDDNAVFSEDIRIPLNKMIGVIGTAPAGDAVPCGVPCAHGGNMDCKEIKEGATLLLPVNVQGALFALGDLHAVMADGEIGVTGVEVAGNVTVTLNVIKGKKLPTPMIYNDEFVMTLASDEDLDIATDMAVANMIEYLTGGEGFVVADAVMLTSLVADVRICQVVDPKKTVRVEFPRKYLHNSK